MVVYRKEYPAAVYCVKVAEQFSVGNVNAHYGLFLKALLYHRITQKLHTGRYLVRTHNLCPFTHLLKHTAKAVSTAQCISVGVGMGQYQKIIVAFQ